MAGLRTCSAQASAGPCAGGDCKTLLQRWFHSKRINDSIDLGPGRW